MINTSYKIRTIVVFLFFCSMYVIVVATLYRIQIKKRDFYIQLAQQQYEVTIKQHSPRGILYDINTNLLAINNDTLSAFILPNNLEKVEQLEPFLKKYFPQSLHRLQINPSGQFMYIKRKLTSQDLQLLQESNIVDIKLLKEPSRFYPIKSVGQIVGITDIDNNGLFGIELLYNKELAGSPATYCLEKEARSGHFYFKKETIEEGTNGQSIKLSIDSDIQFLAYHSLKKHVKKINAQEGSVLIIDPTTGNILAMANYPTFDPNDIAELDQEKQKIKLSPKPMNQVP